MPAILARSRPVVNVDTTLYTVPASKKFTGTMRATNTGTAPAKIRIGVQSVSGAVTDIDYFFYDYVLQADGLPLVLTGEAYPALARIIVRTDVATVNFHITGLEGPA
jgi:hypothetical protein